LDAKLERDIDMMGTYKYIAEEVEELSQKIGEQESQINCGLDYILAKQEEQINFLVKFNNMKSKNSNSNLY
jgi:hypothetical protein